MSTLCVELFGIVGSVFSILSFIPIALAAAKWWKGDKIVVVEIKNMEGNLLTDKKGNPLKFKVKKRFVNNADLTPLVSNMYFDGDRLDKEVRQGILDLTLTKGFEKLQA